MRKMLPILVLVAAAGLAVVLLVPAAPRRSFIVDQADVDRANARAAAVRAAAAPASPHVPAPAVSLSGLRWRMGGFGTVMIASFVLQNGEAFAVKDIDIVCELSAKSGTPIGYAANTVFQKVPAYGRLAVREFNMGSGVALDRSQADAAYCKVGKMSRV